MSAAGGVMTGLVLPFQSGVEVRFDEDLRFVKAIAHDRYWSPPAPTRFPSRAKTWEEAMVLRQRYVRRAALWCWMPPRGIPMRRCCVRSIVHAAARGLRMPSDFNERAALPKA